jgi:hypothetical protein
MEAVEEWGKIPLSANEWYNLNFNSFQRQAREKVRIITDSHSIDSLESNITHRHRDKNSLPLHFPKVCAKKKSFYIPGVIL